MSRPQPRDLAASVAARLRNHAKARGDIYQRVLERHAIERLLYRLGASEHTAQFLLKGGQLFAVWADKPHRPTRDIDLLGFGECSDDRLRGIFEQLCEIEVEPDGWVFAANSIELSDIKEEQDYPGRRVVVRARLGQIKIKVQVDIGFGDVVTLDPEDVEYPAILEYPRPRLRAYRRETLIAEKFQAMVALGITNSRLKDFHDLWILSRDFTFDCGTLAQAIRATFAHRRTAIPTTAPLALTAEFSDDIGKLRQWSSLLKKDNDPNAPDDLPLMVVCEALWQFLGPPAIAAGGGTFPSSWPPGGPWC